MFVCSLKIKKAPDVCTCVIPYFYILKHKMSRSGYYSRLVSYKKPELLTLREHLRSPLVF